MKKLIAMLMIGMFLFSGFAYAKQEQNAGDSPSGLGNVQAMGGERIQAFKDSLPEKRQIAQQVLSQARERYQQAKENYLELREQYRNQRQLMLESKTNYANCKGDDSEECDQIREQARERAREHLMGTADLILNHIDTIIEKVESSEDLSEEEASEILSDLEESKTEIEDAKAVIEGLGEDASNEELQEAANTIKNAWNRIKKQFKYSVGRTVGARLRTVIEKTQQSGERLEEMIGSLEEEGKDVSALNELLNEYNGHVDEAVALYEEATEKWSEATTPGEVDDVAKEVNDLFKQVNEHLREAHELLKEIVKNIKEEGQDITDDSDEEETKESEDEEDTEE